MAAAFELACSSRAALFVALGVTMPRGYPLRPSLLSTRRIASGAALAPLFVHTVPCPCKANQFLSTAKNVCLAGSALMYAPRAHLSKSANI